VTEIRALKIGLSAPLKNGGKVFGVLSEDCLHTCFDLTAPDGVQTRFALSDEALATMVDIAVKLRERAAGVEAVRPPCKPGTCPMPTVCGDGCSRQARAAAGVKTIDGGRDGKA